MQHDSALDVACEINEFILELHNCVDFNALALCVQSICFGHFLFDQMLVTENRKFLLQIRLAFICAKVYKLA